MVLSPAQRLANIPDYFQGSPKQLSPLWMFLSLPLLFAIQRVAETILAPSELFGKFYILIFRILTSDVIPFIIIFMICAPSIFAVPCLASATTSIPPPLHTCRDPPPAVLINYGLAMYLNCPPYVMENSEDDSSNGKWTITSMIQDLIKLGLLGVELPMNVVAQQSLAMDGAKWDVDPGRTGVGNGYLDSWGVVNMGVFVGLYMYYVLMSNILLLNLLIAMMGDTYEDTMKVSKVEWRVAFARRVLLYEILAKSFTHSYIYGEFQLHAGVPGLGDDPDYYGAEEESARPDLPYSSA